MDEVIPVLERLGLGKYAEAFEDEGYDDINWLFSCEKPMLVRIADEINLAAKDKVKFVNGMMMMHERTKRACEQLAHETGTLRDEAAAVGRFEQEVPSEADAKQAVMEAMRDVLSVMKQTPSDELAPISEDTPMFEGGIDSLGAGQLSAALEDRFGVDVLPSAVLAHGTAERLAGHLRQKMLVVARLRDINRTSNAHSATRAALSTMAQRGATGPRPDLTDRGPSHVQAAAAASNVAATPVPAGVEKNSETVPVAPTAPATAAAAAPAPPSSSPNQAQKPTPSAALPSARPSGACAAAAGRLPATSSMPTASATATAKCAADIRANDDSGGGSLPSAPALADLRPRLTSTPIRVERKKGESVQSGGEGDGVPSNGEPSGAIVRRHSPADMCASMPQVCHALEAVASEEALHAAVRSYRCASSSLKLLPCVDLKCKNTRTLATSPTSRPTLPPKQPMQAAPTHRREQLSSSTSGAGVSLAAVHAVVREREMRVGRCHSPTPT
jgi:acyl carrier protein